MPNLAVGDCSYKIACHDVVTVVEFSSFEWSSNLIAYGTKSRVCVGTCRFEDKNLEGLTYENLRDYNHGTRVMEIAWGPDTSLTTVPRLLRFATTGADKLLRVFSSDLKEQDDVQLLDGHTDYINAVTFDPDTGDQLASVSDDHTCRVWDRDGEQRACLPLGSPGVGVNWHTEDTCKIMVAEKTGIIRFYNLVNNQPIMSLDCGPGPLMAADWCLQNPLKVAAISGTNVLTFNTSNSSRPMESKLAFDGGSKCVRWSKCNDNLLACTGCPSGQVKVFHCRQDEAVTCMSTKLQICNGLSWHNRLPVLAVGGDKNIHLWFISSV